jgi:D-3-phosphoglycerate dehydrogenase
MKVNINKYTQILFFSFSLFLCQDLFAKNKISNCIFAFDFDSTIVKNESFEDLILFSIAGDNDKIDMLKSITNMGMNGEIDFKESLDRRLKLGGVTKSQVSKISDSMKNYLTQDIDKTLNKIKSSGCKIIIISGSFKSMIKPTAKMLGIDSKDVFANEFIFDKNSKVSGFRDGDMLYSNGKSRVINNLKRLNPKLRVAMIGDGYNDLVTKIEGSADYFIGFGLNAIRPKVKNNADIFVENIDQLNKEIDKILSIL